MDSGPPAEHEQTEPLRPAAARFLEQYHAEGRARAAG